LINAHLVLILPENRLLTLPSRKFSRRYLAGETCFYLSASKALGFIGAYSKFWDKVSDDGITVNSAYGYWLFRAETGIDWAISCLCRDKDSRKAVAMIYQPDHSVESFDNPCTMYLQFLIRQDQLHCIANMRSNDIWFGLAYDIPFFTLVQEIVYVRLRKAYPSLRMGTYHHNAGSLHLYRKDWERARHVLGDSPDGSDIRMPKLTEPDISYWFKDLLHFEEEHRVHGRLTPKPYTTLFQEWMMNLIGGME
jgi:thymidylate synthase